MSALVICLSLVCLMFIVDIALLVKDIKTDKVKMRCKTIVNDLVALFMFWGVASIAVGGFTYFGAVIDWAKDYTSVPRDEILAFLNNSFPCFYAIVLIMGLLILPSKIYKYKIWKYTDEEIVWNKEENAKLKQTMEKWLHLKAK